MEVVVLVEGEVEFMGLLEVCIMGLGDLVMVGAWVAMVELMVEALEDLWEEVTEMVGVVMEFMEDASHIKEDFMEALLEALLEVIMEWVAGSWRLEIVGCYLFETFVFNLDKIEAPLSFI